MRGLYIGADYSQKGGGTPSLSWVGWGERGEKKKEEMTREYRRRVGRGTNGSSGGTPVDHGSLRWPDVPQAAKPPHTSHENKLILT